ncbi:hypothetical protein [Clostridium botulinum]|uniref:hypothetical protein n=1 Tax=Clostridium botulinum TaxID=1491 RepID=UPI001E2B4647|nr:hypothetical protein [Clostridium botulinum]MCD3223981.1 hypothetical protein [Clostridium botulinum C/D]MCD3298204.1 hypothetical protein [Clostridium botulinum C/D]
MKFEEIKKMLLKDENIGDVELNKKGELVITPNQSKNFGRIIDPIENYMDYNEFDSDGERGLAEFCGTYYEIVRTDWYNGRIYEIVLKESI